MTDNGKIARLIEELRRELGEDTQREGLDRTPERVEKALRYFTSGYAQDVKQVLNDAMLLEVYELFLLLFLLLL